MLPKRFIRPGRTIGALGALICLLPALLPSSIARAPSVRKLAGKPLAVDDLGISLQWIPPGEFFMGDEHQGPVTTVRITQGYWLGKYDVTQGEWQALMGANPSHFKDQGGDAPVENVSWYDAEAFCRALNTREGAAGRLPEGYEYRLPTEAEWEYACRAGEPDDSFEVGGMDDLGWYAGNSEKHTHPVGLKKPNAWGLYDMHGNVWQWCEDRYGPYQGGVQTDPAGPDSGSSRVYRGGCWFIVAEHCRSAFRFRSIPLLRDYYLGFRLALAPRIPGGGANGP